MPGGRATHSQPWAKPALLGPALALERAGDEVSSGCSTGTCSLGCCATCRPSWAPTPSVASETWLQVARDLPGFSGDGDGFRGWVATIARHRAADHLRRARRRPHSATVTVADLETWADGDDTADQALELMATEAAIALISQLPRDQAEAVLLRVVMGLDVVTTARVLDKRPGAVRMASYRGLRRLSGWLEQAAADSGGKAE